MTTSSTSQEMLRFAVVDDDDLAVVSAHLQDASLTLDDVAYLPRARRFAMIVSRVDWCAFVNGKRQRRRTGLHFERVMRVQRCGAWPEERNAVLQLLAVSFRPTTAPSGEVLLTFAGGAMVKLEVECVEAEMRDLGECWPVQACPSHSLDAAAAPV